MDLLKTEKEKMLSGEYYHSRDPELIAMYHRCRKLLREFGEASSEDAELKRDILTRLLGRVGENVWIEAPFFCDYGSNIFIGDNVFINYNVLLLDCNRIAIGNNVLIGPTVQVCTATHPIAARERVVPTRDGSGQTAGYHTCAHPVSIGDNCWIGSGTIILPGVTIGENTTVGAGSVVNKSLPANVLAVGNPCAIG
jgi:maltose O-acetyltransferase